MNGNFDAFIYLFCKCWYISWKKKKKSFLIFFPNGDRMNCSDIYITSLIPYSYKSPAGKVYVGVLSVLQSIFTNCISESLPYLCFPTVFVKWWNFTQRTKKCAICGKKRWRWGRLKLREGEIYDQNKRKLIEWKTFTFFNYSLSGLCFWVFFQTKMCYLTKHSTFDSCASVCPV